MTSVSTLISELERTMTKTPSDKHNDMLRRITDLFMVDPTILRDEHIDVFDTVIARMAPVIEEEALQELAERLADVPNAPPNIVRRLANDDISIARPIIERSERLSENDLMSIAMSKGQSYLLAMSGRAQISEEVTNVLVSRGDNSVKQAVAGNAGAQISERTFARLAAQARSDDSLRSTLSKRTDNTKNKSNSLVEIAASTARKNLEQSTQGLSEAGKAALQQALERSANKVSQRLQTSGSGIAHTNPETSQSTPQKIDFKNAVTIVRDKFDKKDLTEFDLAAYAAHNTMPEAIVAISLLTGISIQAAEKLFTGQDQDLLLIICKSQNWAWATVKALVKMRAAGEISTKQIEKSFDSYDQLTQATAERVLKFLHIKESAQNRKK